METRIRNDAPSARIGYGTPVARISNFQGRMKTVVPPKRFKITPTAVNADLCFDLSLAPASFWQYVKIGGSDIRVTKQDGTTEVPREVASFNQASKTGTLFFATNSGTAFYVYYGVPDASEPSATASNGRRLVWSTNNLFVQHCEGGVTDSTQTPDDATIVGAPTQVNDLVGKAYNFDGVNDYVNIPHVSKMNPTDKFAIHAIVNNSKADIGTVQYSYTLGDTGLGTVVNVSGNNYLKATAGVTGSGLLFSYILPNTYKGSFSIRARGYVSANGAGQGFLRVTDNLTSTVLLTQNIDTVAPTSPTPNGQLTFTVFNVAGNDLKIELQVNDLVDVFLNNIQVEHNGRDGIYAKGNTSIMLTAGDATHGQFRFQTRINSTTASIQSPSTIITATRYHVWAWWDGTTKCIYVNGVSVSSGAAAGTSEVSSVVSNVARNTAFSNAMWPGTIDEVRLVNVPPDATYITNMYNNLSSQSTFWTIGVEEIATSYASINFGTIPILSNDNPNSRVGVQVANSRISNFQSEAVTTTVDTTISSGTPIGLLLALTYAAQVGVTTTQITFKGVRPNSRIKTA